MTEPVRFGLHVEPCEIPACVRAEAVVLASAKGRRHVIYFAGAGEWLVRDYQSLLLPLVPLSWLLAAVVYPVGGVYA